MPSGHQQPTAARVLVFLIPMAFAAALVLLFSTTAFSRDTFCCGYSVRHQGGSKVSLLHSGQVVESDVVTGVLDEPSITVFEVRPYHASDCHYRVAAPPDRLTNPLKLDELDQFRPGLSAAVRGSEFKPMNSRSCFSEQSFSGV